MENVTEIKQLIIAIASQLNHLDKKEVVEAIKNGGKLTKADAGRLLPDKQKKEISITITNSSQQTGTNMLYIFGSFIKTNALRIFNFLFRFIKR